MNMNSNANTVFICEFTSQRTGKLSYERENEIIMVFFQPFSIAHLWNLVAIRLISSTRLYNATTGHEETSEIICSILT